MCIDCLQNQLIEATLRRLDQLEKSLGAPLMMERVDGEAISSHHKALHLILARLERIELCLDSAGLNYSSAGDDSPHPRHRIRVVPTHQMTEDTWPPREKTRRKPPDPAPATSRAASALADAIAR